MALMSISHCLVYNGKSNANAPAPVRRIDRQITKRIAYMLRGSGSTCWRRGPYIKSLIAVIIPRIAANCVNKPTNNIPATVVIMIEPNHNIHTGNSPTIGKLTFVISLRDLTICNAIYKNTNAAVMRKMSAEKGARKRICGKSESIRRF